MVYNPVKINILKNCGNWQINIDSTNCFPKFSLNKKILKLNLNIYEHKIVLSQSIKQKWKSVLAEQALQQETRVRMRLRETVGVVNSNFCRGRSEPMLKGDRTSFTDGLSIIKVMVSILSFVFSKSCFVYYIVFCRITVNSHLYWYVAF